MCARTPREQENENEAHMRDRFDRGNGVINVDGGRFIPPLDELPAAAVLVSLMKLTG